MEPSQSAQLLPEPYYFCGCCGSLVPRFCPALAPVDAADASACGQCGGPAASGGLTVPLYSGFADPVFWPMCALCAVVGRGPYASAATLADVLAARMPQLPDLPLLAFDLSTQHVVEDHLYPDVGWSGFARRLIALGPYSRMRADARVGNIPGTRWWHISHNTVARIVADLEYVRAAREPQAHPASLPCVRCGTRKGRPGCWSGDAQRPMCGDCRDAARGRVLLAQPQGVAQARELLEQRALVAVASDIDRVEQGLPHARAQLAAGVPAASE